MNTFETLQYKTLCETTKLTRLTPEAVDKCLNALKTLFQPTTLTALRPLLGKQDPYRLHKTCLNLSNRCLAEQLWTGAFEILCLVRQSVLVEEKMLRSLGASTREFAAAADLHVGGNSDQDVATRILLLRTATMQSFTAYNKCPSAVRTAQQHTRRSGRMSSSGNGKGGSQEGYDPLEEVHNILQFLSSSSNSGRRSRRMSGGGHEFPQPAEPKLNPQVKARYWLDLLEFVSKTLVDVEKDDGDGGGGAVGSNTALATLIDDLAMTASLIAPSPDPIIAPSTPSGSSSSTTEAQYSAQALRRFTALIFMRLKRHLVPRTYHGVAVMWNSLELLRLPFISPNEVSTTTGRSSAAGRDRDQGVGGGGGGRSPATPRGVTSNMLRTDFNPTLENLKQAFSANHGGGNTGDLFLHDDDDGVWDLYLAGLRLTLRLDPAQVPRLVDEVSLLFLGAFGIPRGEEAWDCVERQTSSGAQLIEFLPRTMEIASGLQSVSSSGSRAGVVGPTAGNSGGLNGILHALQQGRLVEASKLARVATRPFLSSSGRLLSPLDFPRLQLELALSALAWLHLGFPAQAREDMYYSWRFVLAGTPQSIPQVVKVLVAVSGQILYGHSSDLARNICPTPPVALQRVPPSHPSWPLGGSEEAGGEERPKGAHYMQRYLKPHARFLTYASSSETVAAVISSIPRQSPAVFEMLVKQQDESFAARCQTRSAVTLGEREEALPLENSSDRPTFECRLGGTQGEPPLDLRWLGSRSCVLSVSKSKDGATLILSKAWFDTTTSQTNTCSIAVSAWQDRQDALVAFTESLSQIEDLDAHLCRTGAAQRTQGYNDKEEKRKIQGSYWEERYALNHQLGELVCDLESSLLGPWRTFLLGHVVDRFTQLELHRVASSVATCIEDAFAGSLGETFTVDPALVLELLGGLPYLSPAVQRLFNPTGPVVVGTTPMRKPRQGHGDVDDDDELLPPSHPAMERKTSAAFASRFEPGEAETIGALEVALFHLVPQHLQDAMIAKADLPIEDEESSDDGRERQQGGATTTSGHTAALDEIEGIAAWAYQSAIEIFSRAVLDSTTATNPQSGDPTTPRPQDEEHPSFFYKLPRQHVFLMLDPDLLQVPWEALPVLQDHSVSRIPSLQFLEGALLRGHMNHNHGNEIGGLRRSNSAASAAHLLACDISSLRYAINPSEDATLGKSEKGYTKLLDSAGLSWDGLYGSCGTRFEPNASTAGKKNKEGQGKGGFLCKDIFLFVGHNGGENIVSGRDLDKLELPTPLIASSSGSVQMTRLALLMGCGSAKLSAPVLHSLSSSTKAPANRSAAGGYGAKGQPQGIVLDYLAAGVPCVVGCLWTVSGGEIDKVTIAMLKAALPQYPKTARTEEEEVSNNQRGQSIFQLLREGKRKCKFSYLTAAAVVVYGVPIEVLSSHN